MKPKDARDVRNSDAMPRKAGRNQMQLREATVAADNRHGPVRLFKTQGVKEHTLMEYPQRESIEQHLQNNGHPISTARGTELFGSLPNEARWECSLEKQFTRACIQDQTIYSYDPAPSAGKFRENMPQTLKVFKKWERLIFKKLLYHPWT